MSECALWYFRHHQVYVEFHDTEKEAFEAAYYLSASGDGSVAGFQYPDGRWILRDDHAGYRAFLDERNAEDVARAVAWAQELASRPPPPPPRQVKPPWTEGYQADNPVTVSHDAPDWAGRPL